MFIKNLHFIHFYLLFFLLIFLVVHWRGILYLTLLLNFLPCGVTIIYFLLLEPISATWSVIYITIILSFLIFLFLLDLFLLPLSSSYLLIYSTLMSLCPWVFKFVFIWVLMSVAMYVEAGEQHWVLYLKIHLPLVLRQNLSLSWT